MTSRLSDKKSKIHVIDPSGPVRQMMVDVIRSSLGFETVEGKATIADALSYLEVDHIDWILVPLMADQPVNALHLLKICTEQPELKHLRVSLILEESETYVLPAAFELGLLSWHSKPFTKDSLTEEMGRLLKTMEEHKFNEPLVAAHYLRQHLKATKNHALQETLEQGLLQVYPGNPQILFELAEPQFHLDKKPQARKALAQVKLLDPNLVPKVDELGKSLFGDEYKIPPAGADAPSDINVLGLKNVVVIDSDSMVHRSLEDMLKKLGTESVTCFSDGETAFAHLESNPEPDLLIMEWRIPKLSGPMLVQRIRAKGLYSLPIVVLSSLLKADDMPLAREMTIANIVSKPLNKDLLIPALINTLQQERLPTEHAVLERKISNLLAQNKVSDAQPLRDQFLADPSVPHAKKKLIEAKFAFAKADYPAARDAGIEALKHAGDSVIVLNLLGKVFMLLKQHEAALKCLKKAQQASPHNIERMCSIAEVETELGNHTAAKDNIDDAKALDPDSTTVQEAEIKVAITKGDTATAQKLMGELDSLSQLIGYMNNKAVAHAKCGYTQDAVDLYRKTVSSVPEDRSDVKAIVLYNMALAFVRASEFEAAAKELEEVAKFKDSKVAKKAASLQTRLKTSMEKGAAFKLLGEEAAPAAAPKDGAPAAANPSLDDQRSALAPILAKRGDMCCFMIFNNAKAPDARVNSLFAQAPRFQSRNAIERNESGGAERTKKAAS
jgi:CheY-like chemotaxis protein/tetratricopeptide (TPR) repeat protein